MERLFKRPRRVVPLAETAPWPLYGNQRTDRSPDPLAPYNPTLNSKLYIHLGDITQLEVDAIVNAANNSLLGGGGVDGAIHAAAGPALRKECEGLRGCDTGDAKITAGHNLPAKHIIHTVGPRGKKPEVLQSSYDRCFETMRGNELKSIAFPCISTGVYGYPNKAAARVAISTTRRFLESNHVEVEGVVFCLFTKEDIRAYHELLPVYFPLEPSDNTSEIQTSVDVTSNSATCGSSEGETDKSCSKPIDTESQTSDYLPEGEADSLNLPDVPKHEPGGEAMSQSVDVKSEEPMSQTADAFGSEECEAMSQEPNLGEQCEEPMSQTL